MPYDKLLSLCDFHMCWDAQLTRPVFVSHIVVGQAAGGPHPPTLATRPSSKEEEVEEVGIVELEFQLLVLF